MSAAPAALIRRRRKDRLGGIGSQSSIGSHVCGNPPATREDRSACGRKQLIDRVIERDRFHAERAQHPGREPVVHSDQPEQEMLGPIMGCDSRSDSRSESSSTVTARGVNGT